MKKLLTLVLLLLSIGFIASPAKAKATESPATIIVANTASAAQIKVQIGGNNRRRNRRIIRTTRVSPNRRRVVTRTTYRGNGRIVTRKRVIRQNRRY
jgi:hypothetical protein